MPEFAQPQRPELTSDDRDQSVAAAAALFDRSRLKVARELRGLSQVQLAREVGGVKAASLSQFETGHARPSASTLSRLAVALQVPVEFFAAQTRRPSDQETGFFRSLRSTAPRDRARARALVELTRELTLQLESVVALPELDLPRPDTPVGEDATREHVESVAADVRTRWALPPGPIENVVRTIERHGVVTTRFRVKLEKIDAFSVHFEDRPVVVLGADKGWRDRSRFDAAHELGHLILHDPAQAGTKVIETQAHWFAAAFLMPADEIRSELPSTPDWRRLVDLKQDWHVSIAALLMRAKTLEVMNERTYIQALKVMSMRGWRTAEPGDLGVAESPLVLRNALDVAARNGTSLNDLVRAAGLPYSDVQLVLGGLEDPRPRVEL